MDERYDMVRSVVGERYIYIRNYMPHKLYGQHVSYMFQTTTTQVWKKLFDEGKLNKHKVTFGKPNHLKNFMTYKKIPDEVTNLSQVSRTCCYS